MNKVLIVGHPLSGYEVVEQMLVSFGMSAAQPSLKEQMSAIEMGATLCRAHGVIPEQTPYLHGYSLAKQIKGESVWNGLVLDLLRGNLEQPFWGWADPMAIYLLEFWRQAVSDITFVLVYNHPRSVFEGSIARSGGMSLYDEDDPGGDVTAGWKSYNEALLHFYYHNEDRCLLVHSEALRNPGQRGLRQVHTLLSERINSDFEKKIDSTDIGALPASPRGRTETSSAHPDTPRPVVAGPLANTVSGSNDYLATFVVESVLQQYPAEIQLYEELQAVATLPWNSEAAVDFDAVAAWRAFRSLKAEKQKLAQEISVSMENLHHEIEQRQAEKETFELHKQDTEKVRLELRRVEGDLLDAQNENKVLQTALHQSQLHVEQFFNDKNKLKQQLVTARAQIKKFIGAPERVKNELEYQLGISIVDHFKSVWKLIFLPISLWFISRRYRKTLGREQKKLPPLYMYEDFDHVREIKKHLSYRLGWVWLKYTRTPIRWPALPFVLGYTHFKFLRERREKKK